MNQVERLIKASSEFQDCQQLIDSVAGIFIDHGLEPMRINFILQALHPEVLIKLYVWRKDAGYTETSSKAQVFEQKETIMTTGIVKEIYLGNSTFGNPAFVVSPQYKVIIEKKEHIRCRLYLDEGLKEFPILTEFKQSGGTDYIALPIVFSNGSRCCLTLLSGKPKGMNEKDISLISDLLPTLRALLELHESHRITKTLLQTYVGLSPGEQVLNGTIKRGDLTTLDAAIWFSDLRGFTALSATLSNETLVWLLNSYFEVIGNAISEHGGEILKFVGDAVLAIFPVQSALQKNSCNLAYTAAVAANTALQKLNNMHQGEVGFPLQHGIGLHFGEVQYGNIGSLNRLDFTVISSAVNLTSRIENLCSVLNKHLLVSKTFYNQLSNQPAKEKFQHCGEHLLKGFKAPINIYAGITHC